jgi:hypothetical protein
LILQNIFEPDLKKKLGTGCQTQAHQYFASYFIFFLDKNLGESLPAAWLGLGCGVAKPRA